MAVENKNWDITQAFNEFEAQKKGKILTALERALEVYWNSHESFSGWGERDPAYAPVRERIENELEDFVAGLILEGTLAAGERQVVVNGYRMAAQTWVHEATAALKAEIKRREGHDGG